jgi:hypothetical protein
LYAVNLHPAPQPLRCQQDGVGVDEAVRASMQMGRVKKVEDHVVRAVECGVTDGAAARATLEFAMTGS